MRSSCSYRQSRFLLRLKYYTDIFVAQTDNEGNINWKIDVEQECLLCGLQYDSSLDLSIIQILYKAILYIVGIKIVINLQVSKDDHLLMFLISFI